jgi:uncharacterized coiled-coil DUF342 family protein
MARSFKVLGFLLVTVLAIYGCARPAAEPTFSTNEPAAPGKVQRLEEDYRTALAARDEARQQLAAAEEQHAKAKQELEKQLEQTKAAAAAERDALKNEIKARTGERDAVNAQYETFRKTLRELLTSADGAAGALNLPAPKPVANQSTRLSQ